MGGEGRGSGLGLGSHGKEGSVISAVVSYKKSLQLGTDVHQYLSGCSGLGMETSVRGILGGGAFRRVAMVAA